MNSSAYHSMLFPFFIPFALTLRSALPKNSHTPSYQTRSLPSVSTEKSKHATIVCSCSNIVTCDLWRGTKSACNERQRHKDWENRELISAARPHLSTQTHRFVFAVHSAALHAALFTHTSFGYCGHFATHTHVRQT